jgi:UDP-2-acetamido-2,6-beta-L-arabino-hexul-4-ose reductase
MIVGNGLIASGFKSSKEDYSKYIIFASGVSNSKESNSKEYDREKKIIIETINNNKKLKFIYFSSILTGIINNEYYNQKLENEKLIEKNCSNYIIFRVPQIIGKLGNPNNLINYFKDCINSKKEITIYNNTQRSLIDIEDLVNVVNYCKEKVNCKILNFSYVKKIEVLDLCNFVAEILNQKPIKKCINSNSNNNWDICNSKLISDAIVNIDLLNYNYNVIKKYLNK